MRQPSFDPGLTQQYTDNIRRTINPDGSFNVHRRGLPIRRANVYLNLINMSWGMFFALILGAFFLVNAIFAALYLWVGIENLKGAEFDSNLHEFASAFFFSVHTLTTVGYGSMAPSGIAMNTVSALEAMSGLLGFAIATGLVYGRFSRPSARLIYTDSLLVAPYQDGASLQFRIANLRSNILIELEATMLLMTVDPDADRLKRNFRELRLERERVYFLPLTWTIVHPIDENSPLYGRTQEQLAREQAEILVLVKGFDDTFSQVVHSRRSYRHDEFIWGAKFTQIFSVDPAGDLVLELNRINEHQPAPLPAIPSPQQKQVDTTC